MSALPKPYMTPKEYLAAERRSEVRHEYYRGEMFAMAGASREHNLVTHNLGGELRSALKGRPCEVYQSDMRVVVDATGLYTYPDLVIVCGERRFLDDVEVDTLLNPTVLVEVLSPSTENYDRAQKFAHYRRIESLREYVVIAQRAPEVERHTLRDGVWTLLDVRGLESSLVLESIGCTLPLSEIYARIEFPAPMPPVFEPDDPRARPGNPR